MAIAGMILGIIAIVFAFIPVFGAFIAFPCLGVGLPLSGIAFYQAHQTGTGKGQAIAGVATNTVALVMIIAWAVLIGIGISAS